MNPLKATIVWLAYVTHRFEPAALLISAIALTAGGTLLERSFWIAALLVVIGAVLPALALWWERRSALQDDVGLAREKLLEEALTPLLEFAATVTSRPRAERRKDAEMAARGAVRDLRNAFATIRGVRVVVFVVGDDGMRMVPYPPAGRQVAPRDLVRGTPRGERAFAVLERLGERFVIEEGSSTIPSDRGDEDAYQTSISAPIRSSEEGYGLLTIDAPVTGELDRRHGATIALFASALGVLFAEAARGAAVSGYTEPETGED